MRDECTYRYPQRRAMRSHHALTTATNEDVHLQVCPLQRALELHSHEAYPTLAGAGNADQVEDPSAKKWRYPRSCPDQTSTHGSREESAGSKPTRKPYVPTKEYHWSLQCFCVPRRSNKNKNVDAVWSCKRRGTHCDGSGGVSGVCNLQLWTI
jgi:hypothetical protein